jgi:hypothetical protein
MFVKSYTKRFDHFAFPRVGSHFFFHILSGLYDLVLFESSDFFTDEYISRKNEIDPHALYALSLRDPLCGSSCPIFMNPKANGIHGQPLDSGFPVIISIRDPFATIYSNFRLQRDRCKVVFEDERKWLEEMFLNYYNFYENAFSLKKALRNKLYLNRYEELCADSDSLGSLIEFLGVEPKLDPGFVHNVTRFNKFAANTERSFYRDGDNMKWKNDADYIELLESIRLPEFDVFGYP